MQDKDVIKLVVLLGLYAFVGPVLGFFLKGHRTAQRVTFALMCFMTISGLLQKAEWGLTIMFDPVYSGTARGFHFYFNEVLAIALIVSSFFELKGDFRWIAPGVGLYLFHLFCCGLSIVNAPNQLYFWMAAFKALKIILIFIAAFNFIRTQDDIRFFLSVMTYTILWELIAVLKMKYIDGRYQVPGTFEHQNPLAMFVIMLGMVLLAAGSGPRQPKSNLYLFGFVACAAICQSTLSRGGLFFFAAGTVGTILVSLVDRVTKRRVIVVSSLALVGALGLGMTMDTIVKRFNDSYNVASAETRRDLNIAARAILKDHPLGIGWNNFGVAINDPFPYGRVIDETIKKAGDAIDKKHYKGIVESHYYLLLGENGYPGYLSYLLFIGVFLWWNIKAAFRFRYHLLGSVSIGIFVACAANYLQSTLERVLTQPRNLMLWLLLLAIASKIEVWRRITDEQPDLRPVPPPKRSKRRSAPREERTEYA